MATLQKLENRVYEPHAWETVACPFCNSSDSRIWERYGDRWQYTHRLCAKCQLVYCSPRPKYDEQFLYEAYEHYMDDSSSYSDDFATKADYHYPHLKEDILEITRFDSSHESFLDVGCETGTILWMAKKFFGKVVGLEVSKKMASFARENLECEVFTEPFEKMPTERKFSCIHMSHVLEHFPDPHLWLRKAKSLLTPNGILVIKVPNMFSPDRRFKVFLKKLKLRRGKWQAWRTPDHLFEPTIPAMKYLVAQHDFEILALYTYSRQNLVSNSWMQRIFYRKLFLGNNIKIILRAKKS